MNVIFFDLGDVLATYDHTIACKALAAHTTRSPEEIYETIFGSGLEEQHYNRGEYTDEEWYQKCCELLELRDCPFEVFAKEWGAIFGPNPDIESVLSALRPDVRMFVVSNTNGLHWSWARTHLPVLGAHFPEHEQTILSYEVKSRKPERRIFEHALELAGVKPEDAMFVDDKPANVSAFEELGVRGVVYSCSRLPISDLRQGLHELMRT